MEPDPGTMRGVVTCLRPSNGNQTCFSESRAVCIQSLEAGQAGYPHVHVRFSLPPGGNVPCRVCFVPQMSCC